MDHRFPKSSRLRNKKVIQKLFDKNNQSLRSGFLVLKHFSSDAFTTKGFQVLMVVPKRNLRRAVDRNVVKRRMRESYRFNKSILEKSQLNHSALAIIYLSRQVESYSAINKHLVALLGSLRNIKISKNATDK